MTQQNAVFTPPVLPVKIFDTTLRDGEQSPGCSMNLEEKLQIARQLELLGVDIIEAGFAFSSPGDFESVSRVAQLIKDCTVASLSRAVEKDIDASAAALKGAASPRIHTFIATSPIHMKHKLRMTEEQVLERTAYMVAHAKKYVSDIEFSAEDATRSDWDFLGKVVATAIKAGATTINLPDTVGYTTPAEMRALVEAMLPYTEGKAVISLHCHNDLGMAVANSLAGVAGGAGQIECTINGIGERAGNAALEEIVMALDTRRDVFASATRIDKSQIYRTSNLVSKIVGYPIPRNKAIVGKNAFAHESGIHQDGVLKEKTTYEIMTPESVGIPANNMVLGKHSGRHGFKSRLEELGYVLSAEEIDGFFEKFKEISDKKKEITDGDLEAIVASRDVAEATYTLDSYMLMTAKNVQSSCIVRLVKDGAVIEHNAIDDGPVNAAYRAIDAIVGLELTLLHYQIGATSDGRDSLGEVTVRLRHGEREVSGRGLSNDIVESSILAYLNAVNRLV